MRQRAGRLGLMVNPAEPLAHDLRAVMMIGWELAISNGWASTAQLCGVSSRQAAGNRGSSRNHSDAVENRSHHRRDTTVGDDALRTAKAVGATARAYWPCEARGCSACSIGKRIVATCSDPCHDRGATCATNKGSSPRVIARVWIALVSIWPWPVVISSLSRENRLWVQPSARLAEDGVVGVHHQEVVRAAFLLKVP